MRFLSWIWNRIKGVVQRELTEKEQVELAQRFEKAKSRKIAQMFNDLN